MFHCARGYGKTWWLLTEALALAMTKPGVRIVYAAPSREQAKQIVWPTAEMLLLNAPASTRPRLAAAEHAIVCGNGSRIVIDGADDERGNHLRGPFAHLVICDEAAFWRHMQYVIKTVLLPQTSRGVVNGRLLVASTSPESVGHEFVGLCAEAMNEGAYIVRTIDDDTSIGEVERERRMRDMAEEKHKASPRLSTAVRRELLCEFVTETERAVVPEFDQVLHVTPIETRPPWCDKYVAMDLGLVDYAHVLFAHYDFGRAKIVIEDEHVANYQTTQDLAAAVKAKERELWTPDRKDWDPSVPKLRISDNELQQIYDLGQTHGIRFQPALKYDAEAALNNLRGLFASRRVEINQRCKHLIHQLRVGIWNKNRTDYERLPGAGHLDGIDALKYLARHIDYQANPLPPVGYAPDRVYIPPDLEEQRSGTINAMRKLLPTTAR